MVRAVTVAVMTDHDRASRPPQWALAVRPGEFDRRVLDQQEVWVTGQGVVLRVDQMSTEHLRAVTVMLNERAMELHTLCVLDAFNTALLAHLDGLPCGDDLERELTGGTVADVDPDVWLGSTALMRRIDRLLRDRA